MAPVSTAAWFDMPSSSAAMAAAKPQVTGTPTAMSRVTMRLVCPRSLRRSRPRPASYRITATDNDTRGWKAAPNSRCGLTSVVTAPAMKPAGSKMISAGTRSLLASTCEPTASTRISPIPARTWFVVTVNPPFRAPSQSVGLACAAAVAWRRAADCQIYCQSAPGPVHRSPRVTMGAFSRRSALSAALSRGNGGLDDSTDVAAVPYGADHPRGVMTTDRGAARRERRGSAGGEIVLAAVSRDPVLYRSSGMKPRPDLSHTQAAGR